METRHSEKLELLHWNRPQPLGFPAVPANENLPDSIPPGPRRQLSIRIYRQAQPALEAAQFSLARLLEEEARRDRIFLFVPVAMGAGAAAWLLVAEEPSLLYLLLLFMAAAMAHGLLRHRRPGVARLSGAALLLLSGSLLAAFENWRADTVILDAPVTTEISGVVEAREASGPHAWRYLVALSDTRSPHLARPPTTISLLVRTRQQAPDVGDAIRGKARLTPPSGPALPGLNDFALAAWFDGVGATGFLYGPPMKEWAEHAGTHFTFASRLTRSIHQLRAGIGDHIRAVIGGDEGAFAAAIITNEQRAISKPTVEALRLSGLAHIIAISGMNMALSAGIFFVGLRALASLSVGFSQAFPVKKIAAIGALAGTTAYYMISGFAVSAERAFLMMAIMLVAVVFDRPAISLRNIALSALAILLVSPSAILGPSFQMSYAGTLGLVAGYEVWARRKRPLSPPFPAPVWLRTGYRMASGAFMTSLIGGTATALFSIEHFQRFATFGLIANLIVTPLISLVVMPSALISMLLMPLGLDRWPLLVMGWGLKEVIATGFWVAGWGGQWNTGQLPGWYFLAITVSFLLLTLLTTRLRLSGLVLAAAAAALLLLLPAKPPPDLVIAEDGSLAAFVDGSHLSPNRAHPPKFLFVQWQRALRAADVAAPAYLEQGEEVRQDSRSDRYRPLTDEEEIAERAFMTQTLEETRTRHFACKKAAWCLGKLPGGGSVALVENSIYAGIACDVARIVVSRTPRHFTACRSGALLISREVLRQTGALSLHFPGPAARPEITASLLHSHRPWNAFRTYDWRTGGTSPPIPAAIAALIVN